MSALMRFLVLWSGVAVTIVGSNQQTKRVKRVFNSLPVLDRFYPSVRYFAAIGTVHSRRFPLGWANSEFGAWSSGYVACGGALITPGIVQTACHCVAEWEAETGLIIKYTKRSPIVMNVWETAYVVYVGINEEREDLARTRGMNENNYVGTRKFLVHQSCAKLGKLTQQGNTHDLAWITIDHRRLFHNEAFRIPSRIDFAPVYTTEELTRVWSFFWTTRPVCMLVGFGRQHNGLIPQRMMHGWGVTLSRLLCRNLTTHRVPEDEVDSVFTWFCVHEFPRHQQKTGDGDSGGPVACNGHYFGVVEGSSHYETFEGGKFVMHNYSVITHLIFAVYQNSFNYRSAFIQEMATFSTVLYAETIIGRPTFNPIIMPTMSPRFFARFSSASRSSLQTSQSSCISAPFMFTLLIPALQICTGVDWYHE